MSTETSQKLLLLGINANDLGGLLKRSTGRVGNEAETNVPCCIGDPGPEILLRSRKINATFTVLAEVAFASRRGFGKIVATEERHASRGSHTRQASLERNGATDQSGYHFATDSRAATRFAG